MIINDAETFGVDTTNSNVTVINNEPERIVNCKLIETFVCDSCTKRIRIFYAIFCCDKIYFFACANN